MNKKLKNMVIVLGSILVAWIILTFWVEHSGDNKTIYVGEETSKHTALIVYNPDPINNLDERVCASFANGLSEDGFYSKISTAKAVKSDSGDYDLIVLCANTYNFRPDKMIRKYVNNHPDLSNKKVVAITLGAGSTKLAKRELEKLLLGKYVDLEKSVEYWLLKPNDDNRQDEDNAEVACEMAENLAVEIGLQLNN